MGSTGSQTPVDTELAFSSRFNLQLCSPSTFAAATRTTSPSRAARRRWTAMWRKATTVWWTTAKVVMANSTRMALSSASTRWRRTRMKRRATRALRPPRPSTPSTRWRNAVAPGAAPLTRGRYDKPRHHTSDTNTHTHTWIYYYMKQKDRSRACLETG